MDKARKKSGYKMNLGVAPVSATLEPINQKKKWQKKSPAM
jgi:hypothetical protein